MGKCNEYVGTSQASGGCRCARTTKGYLIYETREAFVERWCNQGYRKMQLQMGTLPAIYEVESPYVGRSG